jgi:hypothetical protein
MVCDFYWNINTPRETGYAQAALDKIVYNFFQHVENRNDVDNKAFARLLNSVCGSANIS